MDSYYVNKNPQTTGEHEVHKEGCKFMPEERNKLYLGYFSNCRDAVKKAKEIYTDSDGCYYCIPDCHYK